MVGTGEIKYPCGPKLALLPGSLILIYQGLEERKIFGNNFKKEFGL
jgi:hypothetical protein